MDKIIEFLKGKKSYIVAVVAIIWAVVGLLLNLIEYQTAVDIILGASGLAALRAGLKSQLPPPPPAK